MAENSAIEWTHHTVNFWWGCAKVSPACAHCYAEGQAARFYPGLWGPEGERRIRLEAATKEAMRYERQAIREGRRLRVFTNSMADFFEDRRDLDAVRLEALDVIRQTPHLDWLILTKRPERVVDLLGKAWAEVYARYTNDDEAAGPLALWLDEWLQGTAPVNVWLGTTVEDQERADQRLPHLLNVPAAVRFLSCEPLLGPVDLFKVPRPDVAYFRVMGITGCISPRDEPDDFIWGMKQGLDWVICGGESGRQARPMHPDWARSLRDQCAAAGVPFLFKQWGEYEDTGHHGPRAGDLAMWPDGTIRILRGGQFPCSGDAAIMRRVGKARAGRLLDGQLHDAYPEVARG